MFWTSRCSPMNWAVRPERMECKRERDVMGNIRHLSVLLALHDDVANVAATCDGPSVKRRGLSGLPLENDIAGFDGAMLPQEPQRPRLVVPRPGFDSDHALHRIDAVGQRAIKEERLLPAGVVSEIRIPAVVARWDCSGSAPVRGENADGSGQKIPGVREPDEGVSRS